MERKFVYTSPRVELSELREEFLLCDSFGGQNEDYDHGTFDW